MAFERNGTRPRPGRLEIADWLTARIAADRGISPDDIDPAAPLASIGVGSAEAVGLTGDLEDWLGIRISPTLPYDYVTVTAIAEHLSETMPR